jgi:hypothetical protein
MKIVLGACVVVMAFGGGVGSATAGEEASLLKATPKRVNFGTKAVGTFTLREATITNTGSTDVLVQTSAVRMPDQFSWGLLPGQTCPIFIPAILTGGESCDVVVGFRPEEFFVGLEDTAVLQVAATDPVTGSTLDSVLIEFRGVAKTSGTP